MTRPLKDRVGSYRKVFMAGITTVETGLARPNALTGIAYRADRAPRPQARLYLESRRFFVGEHLEQFEGADCAFTHFSICQNGIFDRISSAAIRPDSVTL